MRCKDKHLRNLYSVHDIEDKAMALILAKDIEEANALWLENVDDDLNFRANYNIKKVKIKEIQKEFQIRIITSLLSEKRLQPGKSNFCTKLIRYYNY